MTFPLWILAAAAVAAAADEKAPPPKILILGKGVPEPTPTTTTGPGGPRVSTPLFEREWTTEGTALEVKKTMEVFDLPIPVLPAAIGAAGGPIAAAGTLVLQGIKEIGELVLEELSKETTFVATGGRLVIVSVKPGISIKVSATHLKWGPVIDGAQYWCDALSFSGTRTTSGEFVEQQAWIAPGVKSALKGVERQGCINPLLVKGPGYRWASIGPPRPRLHALVAGGDAALVLWLPGRLGKYRWRLRYKVLRHKE